MNATFAPRFRLGPYELLVHLASGGMASVILALQHGAAGFERLVVIKRVHRRHLDNRDFRHMFRDEARLASSIRHSNVASVIDVIESEGELSLVMEYFESLSLTALVASANERAVRFSPPVASRIVSDTLAGLHAAHEAVDIRRTRLGIVHRDVSPQNIIVDVGGVSRVIDFGIAKAETRITHTKSGFVKGKLGYMSPEQIEAVPLDRRSDLFAAGIVLRELLTGKRLFSGDDEFETMRRVLTGDIADVSSEVSGIAPELDAVVRKALARSPADRFQTALSFQEALERAVPPSPPYEVGALVAELGKQVLDARHDQLIALLGMDFEKLSPRSPRAVDPGPTKGNTLPLRVHAPTAPTAIIERANLPSPVLLTGPTVRVPIGPMGAPIEALPVTTLKSSEEPHLAGAVTGSVPSSKGSLVSMILVGAGALCVGLLVTFLAIRPDGSSSSPAITSSSSMPTDSLAVAPTNSAIPVALDASEPNGPARAEPSATSATVSASSRPPASKPPPPPPLAATAVTRPKPQAKPLLQPNPYEDSK